MSQSNAVRDTYTKTPTTELRTEGWSPSLQVAESRYLKCVNAISVLKDKIPLWPPLSQPTDVKWSNNKPLLWFPHIFFFSPYWLSPSELSCITSLLSLCCCAVRFHVVSSLIHMCSSSPSGRLSNIAMGILIYALYAGGFITTITVLLA